jgi:hypothetical protein
MEFQLRTVLARSQKGSSWSYPLKKLRCRYFAATETAEGRHGEPLLVELGMKMVALAALLRTSRSVDAEERPSHHCRIENTRSGITPGALPGRHNRGLPDLLDIRARATRDRG